MARTVGRHLKVLRRRYSARTLKVLFAKSGNQCAEPTCTRSIIASGTDFSDEIVEGQIAHIYALSGDGPRGRLDLTEAELNHPSNLLLLCPNHHRVVDGQYETYPAEVLLSWKSKFGSTKPHPHDIRLLGQVRDKLSPDIQTFLLRHDFRTPLRCTMMEPLWEMADNWVGAAHRFHDARTQEVFEVLLESIAKLTTLVAERIYVDDQNPAYGLPLTEMDRMHGITESTRKAIKVMNDAAQEVGREIERFEVVARSRLQA